MLAGFRSSTPNRNVELRDGLADECLGFGPVCLRGWSGSERQIGGYPGHGQAKPRSGRTRPDDDAGNERKSFARGLVAVAHQGRIVYARGFGWADREKQEKVEPESMFRIASVSKPITSVAVLQLVERGKLKLSDRVFNVLKLEEPTGANVKFDARWKQVTILDLLQHTGGWDRDKSFDPMFISPQIVEKFGIKSPAMPDSIIRYMLREPLQFDPGKGECYSNFGYCLLGRVIEKVSGQPYGEYVEKQILAPLGIKYMKLGKTLLSDRARGEVKYYVGTKDAQGSSLMGPNLGKTVPWQYGCWCIEAMDSHGGWIASAPALVRFASAFEDPARCKLLNAKSIQFMFARPKGIAGHEADGKPKDSYYACGWSIAKDGGPGQFNYWHGGLLDGTSTGLVHRCDNITWAVLFNSTGFSKEPPYGLVDGLMHKVINEVKRWPGQ